MTGSERPSPEQLLKKEASPAVLWGRDGALNYRAWGRARRGYRLSRDRGSNRAWITKVMAVALLLTNMNAQFAGLIIPALCYLRKSDSYNVVQRCTAYLCIVAGSGNMAIGCLSALLSS